MRGKVARKLRRTATKIWNAGGTREWTHRQIYRRLKANYVRIKSGRGAVYSPQRGAR